MAGQIEEKFPDYLDALREGMTPEEVMKGYGSPSGEHIPGVIPTIRVVTSIHARHPTGNLVDPGILDSALASLK